MAAQDEEPYLTNAIPGLAAPTVLHRPLIEEPALYRVFGRLDATPDSILSFAGKWGMLGVGEAIPLANWRGNSKRVTEWMPNPASRGKKGVAAGRGELLTRWCQEIVTMRNAVDTWDAIDKEAAKILGKLIHVERRSDGAVAFFERVHRDKNMRIQHHLIYDTAQGINRIFAALSAGPKSALMFRAGLFFVQKEINRRLQDHAHPKMMYSTNAERLDLLKSTTNELTRQRLLAQGFDGAHERLRFEIIRSNLLGAMWLQFARVVEGSVAHVSCANNCGRWIEISPLDGRQQRRRFCGPTCRVSWHRRRG